MKAVKAHLATINKKHILPCQLNFSVRGVSFLRGNYTKNGENAEIERIGIGVVSILLHGCGFLLIIGMVRVPGQYITSQTFIMGGW